MPRTAAGWPPRPGPAIESAASRKRPRLAMLLVLALFLATRAYILFGLQPLASDVSVYFGNAVRAFDLGETPYTDALTIEFPPAAWWVMAAPYAASGIRVSMPVDPAQVAGARATYTRAFRRLMCAFDVAAFCLFALIARRRRPEFAPAAIAVYVLTTSVLGHVLYDRLDAGVLLLLMAGFYSWGRAIERPARHLRWVAATHAALGFGVGYKIIPVLAVPFLLLAELRAETRWRGAATAAASVLAALALPFAVQYAVSGPWVFQLIAFHTGRGIQLESLYATIMATAHVFGWPSTISLWAGGADLAGALAPAMQIGSRMALASFLGGLAVWSISRFRVYDREQAYRMACLALAGSVILSNVLSPQYFVWAAPTVLLLVLELAASRRAFWWFAAMLLGVVGITTWVFPYHYFDFVASPFGLEPRDPDLPLARLEGSFVLLGIRNVGYAGIVAVLGVRLLRSSPWRPSRAGGRPERPRAGRQERRRRR